MTELLLNREPARENGNGWRSTLLGALFTIVILIAGWVATDAQTSRAEMAQQLNSQAQRVAILEEALRNVKDSLNRIESTVNEVRDESRRAARR